MRKTERPKRCERCEKIIHITNGSGMCYYCYKITWKQKHNHHEEKDLKRKEDKICYGRNKKRR